jgi:hypothetical protein
MARQIAVQTSMPPLYVEVVQFLDRRRPDSWMTPQVKIGPRGSGAGGADDQEIWRSAVHGEACPVFGSGIGSKKNNSRSGADPPKGMDRRLKQRFQSERAEIDGLAIEKSVASIHVKSFKQDKMVGKPLDKSLLVCPRRSVAKNENPSGRRSSFRGSSAVRMSSDVQEPRRDLGSVVDIDRSLPAGPCCTR